jgi:serine/threonine protein kinase
LHTLTPQPVLHRDLKPANILGQEHWNEEKKEVEIYWKLADFGIAKLLKKDAQGEFYTATYTGTPIYMAPEVKNQT